MRVWRSFLKLNLQFLLFELFKINPLNQQVYEKFTEFFLSASSLFIIVHLKMCFAFKICVLKILFLRKKKSEALEATLRWWIFFVVL